ncbi:unnamed protein product [Adineta steineri]|uniref:Uncharacterized protein n=1 Tax=Adineta steineri TaxID=433720 RepID=A0A814R6D0_9BILA|nr:unnamed protein product [Adineta steineri]CAF1128340.1 unnamed protein product [Adineta steineri]
MSTVLGKRVQSAYSRPSHRSEITDQNNLTKQRPKTSKNARQPYTNVFAQTELRTYKSSALSSATSHRRRPTTGRSSATVSTRPASRKLCSSEIESLLQTLDHDDTVIVQLDCLANYQTLVQTIDLRKTPIDCQVLCALQQRENRIVQGNACRDTRFQSLIELLQPAYILGRIEEDDLNDINPNIILEHPPHDLPIEYVK